MWIHTFEFKKNTNKMSFVVNWLKRLGLIKTKEYRILIIGLDASGKTSMLYRLKLNENVIAIPTIGFNVETIDHKGISFTAWDVGGRDKIRPLIRHYFANTQAVCFLVDSNDRERMEEAKDYFYKVVNEDELRDCVFCIFCNKQDMPNAMSTKEIADCFDLDSLRLKGKVISAFGCIVTEGKGIYEGLDWLANALSNPHSATCVTQEYFTTIVSTPQNSEIPSSKQEEPVIPSSSFDFVSNELFLSQICSQTTPPLFCHKDHIRVIWYYLIEHHKNSALQGQSRREALKQIQITLQQVYSLQSLVYHETREYFWVQMVDYAIRGTDSSPFISLDLFLTKNPDLCREDLILEYYSQQVLDSTASATEFTIPDKKPLPSRVSIVKKM